MKMKRLICLILALFTVLSAAVSAGEDEMSEEDRATLAEMGETEDGVDDRGLFARLYNTPGKVYQELTAEDFDENSPALWIGKLSDGRSIYEGTVTDDPNKSPSEQAPRSKKLFTASGNTKVEILHIDPQWMILRKDGIIGYTKRTYVELDSVETVDPENTPPINAQKHAWVATAGENCRVRVTMDGTKDSNVFYTLAPGTKLTVWRFEDGWAIVNLWKTYAYIAASELTDLIPVSPTEERLSDDSPIAAYSSYYKIPAMVETKEEKEKYANRCHNIRRGSELISITMQPGDRFDANALMGPYNKGRGYKIAGTLSNGTYTAGYGGGTCQVASTLYNSVVQLPGLKVTKRRAHGGDGACFYLPRHCDAAVGNDYLNFCFINKYDFPIRIEGISNDEGVLVMLIYRAD